MPAIALSSKVLLRPTRAQSEPFTAPCPGSWVTSRKLLHILLQSCNCARMLTRSGAAIELRLQLKQWQANAGTELQTMD